MSETAAAPKCPLCGMIRQQIGLQPAPKARPDGRPGPWEVHTNWGRVDAYVYAGHRHVHHKAMRQCACGCWQACMHVHTVEARAAACARQLQRREDVRE